MNPYLPCLFGLATSVGLAQTTNFVADFESEPVGSIPSGWVTDVPSGVRVEQLMPGDPAGFGSRALRYDGSNLPFLGTIVGSPMFAPARDGKVGFDIEIQSADGPLNIDIRDAAGGSNSRLRFYPDGTIGNYKPSGAGLFTYFGTAGSWAPGTATRIEIDYRAGTLLQDGVSIDYSIDLLAAFPFSLGPAQIVVERSPGSSTGMGFLIDNFLVQQCPLPNSFCAGAPNSTSPLGGGVLAFTGSNFLSTGDADFIAFGLPPHTPILLFHAGSTTSMPLGDGTLCLAPGLQGLYRGAVGMSFGINPPFTNSAQGSVNVDLGVAPYNAGPGALLPGMTWNFQAAYRDSPAFGSGFNFTNALEITFCR